MRAFWCVRIGASGRRRLLCGGVIVVMHSHVFATTAIDARDNGPRDRCEQRGVFGCSTLCSDVSDCSWHRRRRRRDPRRWTSRLERYGACAQLRATERQR
eukprot:Amastigsp_a681262_24.p2 type:complete len:100 gc:universal Amastigsp_a681262_24:1062-763(-)